MVVRVVRLGSPRAADESYCHRSILREMLVASGAALRPPST